jgi:nucleotide-binding universal stress UspA family protein
LVHVIEAEPSLTGLKTISLLLPETEIERRVALRLKDAAVKSALSVRRQNLHALKGKPHVEICQLAADLDADLIIIGTRGQTGLRHLALGSTAERVVRHAPCPVLVSHSLGKRRPPSSFKKILVPTDFSSCSTAGLETAKDLAVAFGAKLLLSHSVDLHYYNTNPEYSIYDYPAVFDAAKSAAREQLEEAVTELRKNGFSAEGVLEFGHAGAAICQEAEKLGATLIVTSTHGHTGLKHVFLGSTAEYVVRHATSPVLVVPSLVRIGSISRRRRVK